MISVAVVACIVSVIAWWVGLQCIKHSTDETVLFGAIGTMALSSCLFIVSVAWWAGWLCVPARYLF